MTGQALAQLPPPPPAIAPGRPSVPTIIDTNATRAGASFGRCGSRNPDNNSVSNVSMISINGQSYDGAIYNAHGTRLA